MENSNSREYLEKITSAVIDNLRQTGPAPSVQMQDVPRKPFGGMTDEEEAELDDLDEDENKDVRMTEHRWDKQVQNDAELDPSDDEDMATANGVTRPNGKKRAFTDHGKKDEDDEGASTPVANKAADEKATGEDEEIHDANDDTIEDIAATEQKEAATIKEIPKEAKKDKVDNDGDVGMEEPAAEDTPTIKKEDEADAEPAPEAPTSEKASIEQPTDEAVPEESATEKKAEVDENDKEAEKVDEKSKEAEAETEAENGAKDGDDAMDVDNDKAAHSKEEPSES